MNYCEGVSVESCRIAGAELVGLWLRGLLLGLLRAGCVIVRRGPGGIRLA
jgi:hypothetical protein